VGHEAVDSAAAHAAVRVCRRRKLARVAPTGEPDPGGGVQGDAAHRIQPRAPDEARVDELLFRRPLAIETEARYVAVEEARVGGVERSRGDGEVRGVGAVRHHHQAVAVDQEMLAEEAMGEIAARFARGAAQERRVEELVSVVETRIESQSRDEEVVAAALKVLPKRSSRRREFRGCRDAGDNDVARRLDGQRRGNILAGAAQKRRIEKVHAIRRQTRHESVDVADHGRIVIDREVDRSRVAGDGDGAGFADVQGGCLIISAAADKGSIDHLAGRGVKPHDVGVEAAALLGVEDFPWRTRWEVEGRGAAGNDHLIVAGELELVGPVVRAPADES
jgi:hypothetical protein